MLPASTLLYIALLVYGTLYPLSGWRPPSDSAIAALLSIDRHASFGDIVTNLVVYIPAGLLLTLYLERRWKVWQAGLFALLLCATLSVTLEGVQVFLPHRVSSLVDVGLNSASAAFGVLAALICRRLGQHIVFHRTRLRITSNRYHHTAGIAAIAVWAASQWTPFVPSLDIGNLWTGVSPLAAVVQPSAWNLFSAGEYASQVAGLGVLIAAISANPYRTAPPLVTLVGFVFAGKILMVGRSLTPEALLGVLVGVLLVAALDGMPLRRRAVPALLLVLASAVAPAFATPATDTIANMNLTPFRMHLQNPLIGLGAVLDGLWPYLAMAALIPLAVRRFSPWLIATGAFLSVGLAAWLEWVQRWHEGRVTDVTDILLAGAGWIVGAALAQHASRSPTSRHPQAPQQPDAYEP